MSHAAVAILTQVAVLTRFKWRAARRQALYSITRTPQGIVVLVLVGLAIASTVAKYSSSPAAPRIDHAREAVGLLLAHAALVVGAICGVMAMLCRDYTIGRRNEPLASSPAVLPALLAYHVLVEAVVVITLQLLAFFYFFNGHVLTLALGRPWISLPVHVVVEVGTVVVAGLAGAWLFRHMLLGRRFLARARVAYQVSVLGMLFGMAGPLLLPRVVVQFAPASFFAYAEPALRPASILYPALNAARAAADGRVGTSIAWIALVALASWMALRLLMRWLPSGPREIAVDSDETAERHYASVFVRALGNVTSAAWPVRAFWLKDFRCARGRLEGSIATEHVPIAAGALGAVALGVALERGGVIPSGTATALLPAIAAGVAAALAGRSGLASLGMEGRNLVLLRTTLPPHALFLAKVAPTAVYASVCSIAYSGFCIVLGAAVGTGVTGAAFTVAAAVLASAAYALFACALGFLLPALSMDNPRGSGASAAGKWLYMIPAAFGTVLVAIAGLMTQRVGAASAVAITVIWFAVVLATGLGVAALSIKRLPHREL